MSLCVVVIAGGPRYLDDVDSAVRAHGEAEEADDEGGAEGGEEGRLGGDLGEVHLRHLRERKSKREGVCARERERERERTRESMCVRESVCVGVRKYESVRGDSLAEIRVMSNTSE